MTPEKFWSRTETMPNGCIEWRGASTVFGYGHLRHDGRYTGAHRLAWKWANGPIPHGMYVCHRCDNPLCVNTLHLFLGTPGDNIRDCVAKDRFRPGRLFGESNRASKLTEIQVREIRSLQGLIGCRRVGRQYGVSKAVIQGIWNRTSWKHVEDMSC